MPGLDLFFFRYWEPLAFSLFGLFCLVWAYKPDTDFQSHAVFLTLASLTLAVGIFEWLHAWRSYHKRRS